MIHHIPSRTNRGRLALGFAALAAVVAAPAGVQAQASFITPLGTEPTASGSSSLLSDYDDHSGNVSLTDVFPDGVNFGGTTYTQLHIGTNGYITFGHGNSSYSPEGIAGYTQGPIIAPQYDDLDPSKGGRIYYDQNAAGGYVVVTYEDVRPYADPNVGGTTSANSFQVVLRKPSGGANTDFRIELRYVKLEWAGVNDWPTAGWSAGDQTTYSELPESGQSNFRDLRFGSNVGVEGVYRWDVEGGVVQSTPTVNSTASVSSITGTGAESGGNVSSDGGSTVTVRGLAFGTSSGPTIASDTVVSGSGTGSFTATIDGLTPSTTYYVRAFATNSLGTAYGPQQSFTTLSVTPPSVSTGAITAGTVSADGNAEVTSDGGASVTDRGLAWGTSADPTIADNSVSAGSGTGAFTAEMTGLTPGTTYYVRGWATNSEGTGYGGNVSFSTEKLEQSVTFASLDERVYGDESFDLEATASSELPVSFSIEESSVATLSGHTVTIVGVGSVTITASQEGDAQHHPADDVERVLTVAPLGVAVGFTVPEWKAYDGTADAEVLSRSVTGVLVHDEGAVSVAGREASYDSQRPGSDKPVTLSGMSLEGSRAHLYEIDGTPVTTADIGPAPPYGILVVGPNEVTAGAESEPFEIRVLDRYGNRTPLAEDRDFNIRTDEAEATASFHPGATVTVPAGGHTATFTYSNTAAGDEPHRLYVEGAVQDPFPGGPAASHYIGVRNGPLHSIRVEPASTLQLDSLEAGETLHLRAVGLDEHGNRAADFDGRATVTSNGNLSVGAGETAPFEAGLLEAHSVAFAGSGEFSVTFTVEQDPIRATGSLGPLRIASPPAEVRLQVETSDPNPALGDEVTLLLTVTNQGEGAAHDVVIPNPVAGQERLQMLQISADSGHYDEGSEAWLLETLEPGRSVEIEIRVRAVRP